MRKLVAASLLVLGMSTFALAGLGIRVPEVDAAAAVGALTLIGGALIVLRARHNRK